MGDFTVPALGNNKMDSTMPGCDIDGRSLVCEAVEGQRGLS